MQPAVTARTTGRRGHAALIDHRNTGAGVSDVSLAPESSSTHVDEPVPAMTAPTGPVLSHEAFEEEVGGVLPPCPNVLRNPFRAIVWVIQALFGVVSLVLALAVVAAIPILNFYALGYLLEVEGRVARTGRLRTAFPLVTLAPRLGSIALGVGLWLIPIRLAADRAADAVLLDPGGAAAFRLQTFTTILALAIGVHICLALARGGSIGCFLRPIKNIRWLLQRYRNHDYWDTAERNVREFVAGLRFRHHFSLGFRGFLGALAWLFIPTLLFASADTTEGGAIVVTLLGGLMLIIVFMWMPFLQARFASENRLGAMFDLRAIRKLYLRSPISWFLSVVVTYVLAVPLYLAKVRLPPQDALWMVTILFIVSIYPARVFVGWAYSRATRREDRAWFGFRWLFRAAMFPLLLVFVFLVFFSQAIGEHGKFELFSHHAFLLPTPFWFGSS